MRNILALIILFTSPQLVADLQCPQGYRPSYAMIATPNEKIEDEILSAFDSKNIKFKAIPTKCDKKDYIALDQANVKLDALTDEKQRVKAEKYNTSQVYKEAYAKHTQPLINNMSRSRNRLSQLAKQKKRLRKEISDEGKNYQKKMADIERNLRPPPITRSGQKLYKEDFGMSYAQYKTKTDREIRLIRGEHLNAQNKLNRNKIANQASLEQEKAATKKDKSSYKKWSNEMQKYLELAAIKSNKRLEEIEKEMLALEKKAEKARKNITWKKCPGIPRALLGSYKLADAKLPEAIEAHFDNFRLDEFAISNVDFQCADTCKVDLELNSFAMTSGLNLKKLEEEDVLWGIKTPFQLALKENNGEKLKLSFEYKIEDGKAVLVPDTATMKVPKGALEKVVAGPSYSRLTDNVVQQITTDFLRKVEAEPSYPKNGTEAQQASYTLTKINKNYQGYIDKEMASQLEKEVERHYNIGADSKRELVGMTGVVQKILEDKKNAAAILDRVAEVVGAKIAGKVSGLFAGVREKNESGFNIFVPIAKGQDSQSAIRLKDKSKGFLADLARLKKIVPKIDHLAGYTKAGDPEETFSKDEVLPGINNFGLKKMRSDHDWRDYISLLDMYSTVNPRNQRQIFPATQIKQDLREILTGLEAKTDALESKYKKSKIDRFFNRPERVRKYFKDQQKTILEMIDEVNQVEKGIEERHKANLTKKEKQLRLRVAKIEFEGMSENVNKNNIVKATNEICVPDQGFYADPKKLGQIPESCVENSDFIVQVSINDVNNYLKELYHQGYFKICYQTMKRTSPSKKKDKDYKCAIEREFTRPPQVVLNKKGGYEIKAEKIRNKINNSILAKVLGFDETDVNLLIGLRPIALGGHNLVGKDQVEVGVNRKTEKLLVKAVKRTPLLALGPAGPVALAASIFAQEALISAALLDVNAGVATGISDTVDKLGGVSVHEVQVKNGMATLFGDYGKDGKKNYSLKKNMSWELAQQCINPIEKSAPHGINPRTKRAIQ